MTDKAKGAGGTSWLDEAGQSPMIDQYAGQMDSFIQAMADGKIDASEIEAQEARLVSLMKEIEPQLGDPLHERVTQLLCELTVFNVMQMLHAMHANRPPTQFQG